MYSKVRVDGKGRITLPKEVREALNIKEGDELIVIVKGGKIILEKIEDPFRTLEKILGDLTFSRELRKIAEEEALKILKRHES